MLLGVAAVFLGLAIIFGLLAFFRHRRRAVQGCGVRRMGGAQRYPSYGMPPFAISIAARYENTMQLPMGVPGAG